MSIAQLAENFGDNEQFEFTEVGDPAAGYITDVLTARSCTIYESHTPKEFWRAILAYSQHGRVRD
jgi:hypothetical protein